MDYPQIEQRIASTGLMVRGGFYPDKDDGIPVPCSTLILIGNAGPQFWRAIEREADMTNANPIEDWSREILTEAAKELEADVLFPFTGPPYLPFLRWAQKAEPVFPSPIGPLIHPDYGLWHAYRGALAFGERIDVPPSEDANSPCETCLDRPCLNTCPVDAVGSGDYDAPACAGFLAGPEGTSCLSNGCAARRACPLGQDYLYTPAQAGYHMNAFLKTFGPDNG
ncbi:MAG: ferredoxin [Rhodospirillaceae bacterium]|jgi:hypothetical protein